MGSAELTSNRSRSLEDVSYGHGRLTDGVPLCAGLELLGNESVPVMDSTFIRGRGGWKGLLECY